MITLTQAERDRLATWCLQEARSAELVEAMAFLLMDVVGDGLDSRSPYPIFELKAEQMLEAIITSLSEDVHARTNYRDDE